MRKEKKFVVIVTENKERIGVRIQGNVSWEGLEKLILSLKDFVKDELEDDKTE